MDNSNSSSIKNSNLCTKDCDCASCSSIDFCQAWHNRYQKIIHKPTMYCHFDYRVQNLSCKSILQYILDPDKIAHHAFQPFLMHKLNCSKFNKKNNAKKIKFRNIFCSAHFDSLIFKRYQFLINYQYEKWLKQHQLDDCILAYRSFNYRFFNIDIVKRVINFIEQQKQCLIFVGDFTNFFETLDHAYLKKQLCKILNVDKLAPDYYAIFKNTTKFAYIDRKIINEIIDFEPHLQIAKQKRKYVTNKDRLEHRSKLLNKVEYKVAKKFIQKNDQKYGVPQGQIVSSVFANLYMADIDNDLNTYIKEKNGLYIRYSDDFLVILPFQEDSELPVYVKYLQDFFSERNNLIQLQPEKTDIRVYREQKIFAYPQMIPTHLDYLGFYYYGKEHLTVRPKSISKYYYRLHRKAKGFWNCRFNGKNVSTKNLYQNYSWSKNHHSFFSYISFAKDKLNLKDPAVDKLLKNHKQKVLKALKTQYKNQINSRYCFIFYPSCLPKNLQKLENYKPKNSFLDILDDLPFPKTLDEQQKEKEELKKKLDLKNKEKEKENQLKQKIHDLLFDRNDHNDSVTTEPNDQEDKKAPTNAEK